MPKLAANRTLKHQSSAPPRLSSGARLGSAYSDDELRETGTAELQAGDPKRLVATIYRLVGNLAAARFNEREAGRARDVAQAHACELAALAVPIGEFDEELIRAYSPAPKPKARRR